MTDAVPLRWSQRVSAWFLMLVAFIVGVGAGVVLTTTWDIDRMSREMQRKYAEAIAQISSRPTLHQRLDAIEQRLQGIEERLTPSP
jgi:hypothetical protein